MNKSTTFYEDLQNNPKIDGRDNRGKNLNMPLTILKFSIALLSNRDGNLSSIHRHMVAHNEEVAGFLNLNISAEKLVSRSHLPLLLCKIKGDIFSKTVFKYFEIELSETEVSWFAGDGKELKGSIELGKKRGEAIVQLVRHEDRAVVGETFYNGSKDSEVPAIKDLLETTNVDKQKTSLDALHLKPNTLEGINGNGGKYLVGLKRNQKELYTDMDISSKCFEYKHNRSEEEKGHGRLEERYYESFDISDGYFDKRWENVDFQTLIKVYRKRKVVKTGVETEELSYYMSNISTKSVQSSEELFTAVRNHWQIEVNNNTRDTVLQEDKLRTSDTFLAKAVARIRTLTVKLLSFSKLENKKAQLDFFADNFQECLLWLRSIKFL